MPLLEKYSVMIQQSLNNRQPFLENVSLLKAVYIIVILLNCTVLVFCSKSTSPNPPLDNEQSLQTILAFTDSTYMIQNSVTQYTLGDSVYVVAREFDQGDAFLVVPPTFPLWVYSKDLGDVELFYLSRDTIPYATTFNLVATGAAFRPIINSAPHIFDGLIEIAANGDSLTAYYFSPTIKKLISVSAEIEVNTK